MPTTLGKNGLTNALLRNLLGDAWQAPFERAEEARASRDSSNVENEYPLEDDEEVEG